VAITPEVRTAIASMSAFAPLHIDSELEEMKIVENLLEPVPQMAVFDTGFHRRMPLSALPVAAKQGPGCVLLRPGYPKITT
jgi:acetate kinase